MRPVSANDCIRDRVGPDAKIPNTKDAMFGMPLQARHAEQMPTQSAADHVLEVVFCEAALTLELGNLATAGL